MLCQIVVNYFHQHHYTAEFAHIIDDLFDSLNGWTNFPSDGKKDRCALNDESPHLELWSKLLPNIANWKLIDLKNGQDVTAQYSFVRGWQITLRSMIYLWNSLKNVSNT